jgi:hypothetical protein
MADLQASPEGSVCTSWGSPMYCEWLMIRGEGDGSRVV